MQMLAHETQHCNSSVTVRSRLEGPRQLSLRGVHRALIHARRSGGLHIQQCSQLPPDGAQRSDSLGQLH